MRVNAESDGKQAVSMDATPSADALYKNLEVACINSTKVTAVEKLKYSGYIREALGNLQSAGNWAMVVWPGASMIRLHMPSRNGVR